MELSEEQKRYQAESDAHTLAEAKLIQQDSERLLMAKEEADRVAKAATKRAKAYRDVSKRKRRNPEEPGRTRRQPRRPTSRAQSRQPVSPGRDIVPGIPAPPAPKSGLF